MYCFIIIKKHKAWTKNNCYVNFVIYFPSYDFKMNQDTFSINEARITFLFRMYTIMFLCTLLSFAKHVKYKNVLYNKNARQ